MRVVTSRNGLTYTLLTARCNIPVKPQSVAAFYHFEPREADINCKYKAGNPSRVKDYRQHLCNRNDHGDVKTDQATTADLAFFHGVGVDHKRERRK